MRKYLLIIIVVVVTSFESSQAQKQKHWSLCGKDARYLYFLDSTSIKKADKNHYFVWIKTQPLPDSLESVRRLFITLKNPFPNTKGDRYNTSRYEDYLFTINKVEVDCANDRVCYVSNVDYAEDGSVIRSVTTDEDKWIWQDIVPHTVGSSLRDKVCN